MARALAANGRHLAPTSLAVLAALLFGASTPLSKWLLGAVGPFALAGLLYLGAAALVTPALVAGKRREFRLPGDTANRLRLLGSVVFGGALGPVLLLLGLRSAPAASVSIWLNLETVATAVIASALFHEHLGRRAWLANGGVFLAGALLSLGGWSGLYPALFVAAACLAWGVDNNLTALIDGITPATVTFWKGLLAGTANLLIGFAVGESVTPVVGLESLLLGGLAYGGSITLYITAAQRLGAARSQMLFASAPFFGLALSLLLLREPLTPWQAVAALILLGSWRLLFSEEHSHVHTHQPLTHVHAHEHSDLHHGHEAPELARHSALHQHTSLVHRHPHWPDLHHRHEHEER
ncbi:MAG: DMT family transporter [Chloroflexi bacterium]|nr:DMT family transporter [Chloroflexota bacterium]MCL5109156.1 DMT family transporter [Chloroflexota bacterium]